MTKNAYNKEYYEKNRAKIIAKNTKYHDKKKNKIRKKAIENPDGDVYLKQVDDYYEDIFIWNAF